MALNGTTVTCDRGGRRRQRAPAGQLEQQNHLAVAAPRARERQRRLATAVGERRPRAGGKQVAHHRLVPSPPLPRTMASINAVQCRLFTWSTGAPAAMSWRTTPSWPRCAAAISAGAVVATRRQPGARAEGEQQRERLLVVGDRGDRHRVVTVVLERAEVAPPWPAGGSPRAGARTSATCSGVRPWPSRGLIGARPAATRCAPRRHALGPRRAGRCSAPARRGWRDWAIAGSAQAASPRHRRRRSRAGRARQDGFIRSSAVTAPCRAPHARLCASRAPQPPKNRSTSAHCSRHVERRRVTAAGDRRDDRARAALAHRLGGPRRAAGRSARRAGTAPDVQAVPLGPALVVVGRRSNCCTIAGS